MTRWKKSDLKYVLMIQVWMATPEPKLTEKQKMAHNGIVEYARYGNPIFEIKRQGNGKASECKVLTSNMHVVDMLSKCTD